MRTAGPTVSGCSWAGRHPRTLDRVPRPRGRNEKPSRKDQPMSDTTTPEAPQAADSQAPLPPVPMLDTIQPRRTPPSWRGAVRAYGEGPLSQWPEDQIMRFARVVGISVTGAPAMAHLAREVDCERLDATPADVPPFLDARAELGHHDGTVYCSRAPLPEVFAHLNGRRPRLHIATLDDHPWTPAELAANIQANPAWRVPVDAGELAAMIWAIQCYRSDNAHPWDTSLVYGTRDFWDPQRHPAAAMLTGLGGPYLCPEPMRDRPVPGTDDLAVFLRGSPITGFTNTLLRLM